MSWVKMSILMPDDEQLAMVKQRVEEFIAYLPLDDDGRKILIERGGS